MVPVIPQPQLSPPISAKVGLLVSLPKDHKDLQSCLGDKISDKSGQARTLSEEVWYTPPWAGGWHTVRWGGMGVGFARTLPV